MYEIHLTIDCIPSARWPALECYAAAIAARPMLIELARGAHPVQPMLTLQRDGTLDEVVAAAHVLARDAAHADLKVVRCKIERDASGSATPGHPGLLCYFEWHGRMVVPEALRPQVLAVCQPFGGHLSNNALSGGDRRYVTLREHGAIAALRARVAALATALAGQGWSIHKQQWEQVVYDSNIALDTGWLEATQ